MLSTETSETLETFMTLQLYVILVTLANEGGLKRSMLQLSTKYMEPAVRSPTRSHHLGPHDSTCIYNPGAPRRGSACRQGGTSRGSRRRCRTVSRCCCRTVVVAVVTLSLSHCRCRVVVVVLSLLSRCRQAPLPAFTTPACCGEFVSTGDSWRWPIIQRVRSANTDK